MSKLTFTQKRIRASDRILRKEYWRLKKAIKEHLNDVEYQEKIQDRINYFEETRERIEISI